MHFFVRFTGQWLNSFYIKLGSLKNTLWAHLSPQQWQLKYSYWFQHIPVHLIAKQTTFQHSFVWPMKYHADDCSACFIDEEVTWQRIWPTIPLSNSQEGNLHYLLHLKNCGPYTTIGRVSISLGEERRDVQPFVNFPKMSLCWFNSLYLRVWGIK